MTIAAEEVRDSELRITAVIVLYQRSPSRSAAFLSLQNAYSVARSSNIFLQIVLYDNTPGGQEPGELADNVEYVAAQKNQGLANPYNWAMERALKSGCEWLLTLDQDTALPSEFLRRIGAIASAVAENPAIGAIVPQVVENGQVISPYHFKWNAIPSYFHSGSHGILADAAYAFNSGALLRIRALQQVGGL